MAPDSGGLQLVRRGQVGYFESPLLAAYGRLLTHAFFTRHGGVSSGQYSSLNFSSKEGDTAENVSRNLEIAASSLGFSAADFLLVRQVHGDGILTWNGNRPPVEPLMYDGIVTSSTGIALCIKTADCVPVLLADPVKKIIGAVHAGWRGTAARIVQKAVLVMQREYSCRPENILASEGPAIGPCCYEVDESVIRAMCDRSWAGFVHKGKRPDRWMLDLAGINGVQLHEAGLPPGNISIGPVCTSCRTDLLYSHRAESGRTGRSLNFIMLKVPAP
ncbi:MAG: peptidoglycan editing factor PgeF [Syntrophales bacterium]